MDKEELREELSSLGRDLLIAILTTTANILVRAAIHRIKYGSLLNEPPRQYPRPAQRRYVFEEDEDEDDERPLVDW